MKPKEKQNGQVNGERRVSTTSAESDGNISNLIPTPPDGGWGWVIVAASLVCNIIVDGIGYSFGIFLPEFVRYFDSPRSKVSLVGSLLCGTYLCAGPIVSALTNKFGCRPVAITGSIISTIAFVLSVFAPSIDILILTYGVIGGFGFGMIYLPSIVSVGYYFERRRAVATGIAVCGSGIGTFIFAPLTKYLLDELDWKNAMFILAGIVFNGCVCGMLMRPLEPKKKPKKEPARQKTVIDRIKEQTVGRRKKFTSESSGIGPTDTTEILEKVRQAKLLREKGLQETESEICSLPSIYFEKDKHISRQDSTSSTAKRTPRVAKLSFSERTDRSSFSSTTPVTTPKITVQDSDIGPESGLKTTDALDGVSDLESSMTSSVSRPKSPESERVESPTKKRMSATSGGSYHEKDKIILANGVHAYEIQPLIKVGNGGIQTEVKHRSGTKELLARSGAGHAGSRHLLGASTRSITSKDYSRPMYKKDIFYSGSIVNINEFRSQPSMTSYITSITSIPGETPMDRADGKMHKWCSCLPKPVVDVLSEMLDVSLLTNLGFMCICLGNIFAMIGFYVPFVYIVDRAVLLGIDKTKASFLLSVIGITNTVGRIISGGLAGVSCVNSLMLNNVSMLIAGAAIMLTPFCNDYVTLVIAASVFGLCTAAYISLTSIIICDLLGLEKLTNAFGLLTLARGVSTAIGPPIAGAVFQSTGDYDASFYLGGALFLCGAMLHFVLFLPCLKNKEETFDVVSAPDMEMTKLSTPVTETNCEDPKPTAV